jgi:hypothetical protein
MRVGGVPAEAILHPSLARLAIGAPHAVSRPILETALRRSFHTHAGGSPVVWSEHGDELQLDPDKLRVATHDRLILVAVPVSCKETKGEATVAFACNPVKAPLGLVLATEATPRGPRLIVERWGEAITACAWVSLVEALSSLVKPSACETLQLVGLGAHEEGVVVVMQRKA